MQVKDNLVPNFMKHWGFEVSSVLIKLQILGPQMLFIFKKMVRITVSPPLRKGICQKAYMSEEVYLANKTCQEITLTPQVKTL